MEPGAATRIVGWITVLTSVTVSCLWAFWGIIENFHEGWYHPSMARNVAMMFGQYLSPVLLFVGLGLVALRWPWAGAAAYIVVGLGLRFAFFRGLSGGVTLLLLVPMLLLATGFAFGRARPLKWAYLAQWCLPLATVVIAGAAPAWTVATRDKKVEPNAQTVVGNGVRLEWAPAGPGWPDTGVTWDQARSICRHLSTDGKTLLRTEPGIWRLPTVDETVRSMTKGRANCGGVWNAAATRATYRRTPDKEAPLWNPHSMVIYWWTATEAAADKAYIVVYNGGVWPRDKRIRPGYLGFRAVKDVG